MHLHAFVSSSRESGEPSGGKDRQAHTGPLDVLQEDRALVPPVDRSQHVHAHRSGLLDRQH